MDRLFRHVEIERKAVDAKARTVRLAFSSELPVPRGGYDEVLSHREGDYDFSRLNNSAAVLLNHDMDQQVGVVESARVESDGSRPVGRAVIRFGKGQLADEVFNDVADGIRRHVSVGYSAEAIRDQGDGAETRFRWLPYELSIVAAPADATVGIGRAETVSETGNKNMNQAELRTEVISIQKALVHDFPHVENMLKAITARALTGEDFNWRKEMMECVRANKPVNETVLVRPGEMIGMSDRDIAGFSFRRAIASAAENGGTPRNCPEADFADQARRTMGFQPKGFFIPADLMTQRTSSGRRDLQVGVWGQGGAAVETTVLGQIIELLRNRLVCYRLGARVLSGLQGNIQIPRQTAPSTAQNLGEIAPIADSTPVFDAVTLTPHRVGDSTTFSKQFLLQGSIDVENFVREDLIATVGVLIDLMILNGSGAGDQPLGIMQTPGIGSITFGGTATFAKAVAFETALSLMNADEGRMAYVTTPGVRAAWKTIAQALTGATTVSSVPLWQEGGWNDGTNDGKVNGYRAAATNQIPNNLVLFGDWSSVMAGMWGGLDIIVDPYTKAKNAEVVVTVNAFIDCALRHAQSFCASADAGNQ